MNVARARPHSASASRTTERTSAGLRDAVDHSGRPAPKQAPIGVGQHGQSNPTARSGGLDSGRGSTVSSSAAAARAAPVGSGSAADMSLAMRRFRDLMSAPTAATAAENRSLTSHQASAVALQRASTAIVQPRPPLSARAASSSGRAAGFGVVENLRVEVFKASPERAVESDPSSVAVLSPPPALMPRNNRQQHEEEVSTPTTTAASFSPATAATAGGSTSSRGDGCGPRRRESVPPSSTLRPQRLDLSDAALPSKLAASTAQPSVSRSHREEPSRVTAKPATPVAWATPSSSVAPSPTATPAAPAAATGRAHPTLSSSQRWTPTPLEECVIVKPKAGEFCLATHWPEEWQPQRRRYDDTHRKSSMGSSSMMAAAPSDTRGAAPSSGSTTAAPHPTGYYRCTRCKAPLVSLAAKVRPDSNSSAGNQATKRGAGLFDRLFRSAVETQLVVPTNGFMAPSGSLGLAVLLRCSNCKGFVGEAAGSASLFVVASHAVEYDARPVPAAYAALEGPLELVDGDDGDEDSDDQDDGASRKPVACVVVKVKKLPTSCLPSSMQASARHRGALSSSESGSDDEGDDMSSDDAE